MAIARRVDDERVLSWLDAAAQGWSSAEIAKAVGTSPEYVRATCQRAYKADLAESGEDRAVVLQGYPWVRAAHGRD